MNLDQFHDLKLWHRRHHRERPFDKQVRDWSPTVWLAGWVGTATA